MINDRVAKKRRLEMIVKELGNLAIAFSGGVDSTFLLAVASAVLGKNVLALTAVSPIHAEQEALDARAFTAQSAIAHIWFDARVMEQAGFLANTKDRCYLCKMSLFEDMIGIAREAGIRHVAHGANMDDLGDYRPGSRAAREMRVLAPLIEAGLTKNEIRSLSRDMGLTTWNKPAMACLASRIPYGTPITADILERISKAEAVVRSIGVRSCRVRHHGKVARIELDPQEFEKLIVLDNRLRVVEKLRQIGYDHVALDLEGYVSGSLNRGVVTC